jgi:hypothetical protein
MAISLLRAMSVDFQCVGRVMSTRGGKEHKSAHSARPGTSASRVFSSFSNIVLSVLLYCNSNHRLTNSIFF